jgi:hypothetical protein
MKNEKEKKGQPYLLRITPRPALLNRFLQECKEKEFNPSELFNQMCRERYKV